MIKTIKSVLALSTLFSASVFAACPDGTSFDSNLDFCADETNVFGPFTNEMMDKCVQFGGGSACTNTYEYSVQGNTIDVLRWSKAFATNLRGDGDCPSGSVRSSTYGGHCFEDVPNATNNVYGNFDAEEVAACESLSGGTACYTNRWGANFYLSVKDRIANPPVEPPTEPSQVENRLGAWLWYIDETGMNRTHAELADELAALGVKRVLIKIADDTASCSYFPDACSTATTQTYKDRGIEPWAWSYNYPGDEVAQADALYQAARYGYVGYVLDIEVEFDRLTTELHAIMQAFEDARQDAIRDGHAAQTFPMGVTTWGNPSDHGMRVDIIDQYVDFHMPQTYLEVWGSSYMADPKRWIELGNTEYRDMGANKPIWHIVSTEHDVITASQVNEFIDVAGPNTSVWRIPAGEVPQAVWNDWSQFDWNRSDFDPSVVDHAGNNDMTPWLLDEVPTPVDPPAQPDFAYYHQLDNYYDPYGTCSVTSIAMITDTLGITNPAVNGRSPDYVYEQLGGVVQTVPDLQWGFNKIASDAGSSYRSNSTTSGTISELRAAVQNGKMAIIHGWFTSVGHIMVVTGFDGTYYTVNDPYGQWNGVKFGGYNSSVSGEQIKYHKDDFDYAINDNGAGNDLWLHIIE